MVIVANSSKNIYKQMQSDSIKSNSFTLSNTNEKKLITGFKVSNYEPLCFRLLKKVDKLKHLAEKKRLLYVALTRAQHDVVISGTIYKKKDGSFSLSQASYLRMIAQGLDIKVEELFDKSLDNSIDELEDINIVNEQKILTNETITLKPLVFEEETKIKSATSNNEISQIQEIDNTAAKLGTISHKIFELYWDKLDGINMKNIFEKFEIEDESEKTKVIIHIQNFKTSDVYQLLKDGAEHRFELEFNHKNKIGYIDLIYFDNNQKGWVIIDFKTGEQTSLKIKKYREQLEFYEEVLVY